MNTFRYILLHKPTEWTEELRGKFIKFLDKFFGLLKCMQVSELEKNQINVWPNLCYNDVCKKGHESHRLKCRDQCERYWQMAGRKEMRESNPTWRTAHHSSRHKKREYVQKGHESHRLERRDVRGTGWRQREKRCMKALLAGEQHITIAAAQRKNAKWKASCEMSKFLHEAQFICQNCRRICATVNHKLDY